MLDDLQESAENDEKSETIIVDQSKMFNDGTNVSRIDSAKLVHSTTQENDLMQDIFMKQTSEILGVSNFARGQLRLMRSSSQTVASFHRRKNTMNDAKKILHSPSSKCNSALKSTFQ